MTTNDQQSNQEPLDAESVKAIYDEHSVPLKRFLLSVLKDESTANDALQTTFIRLLEKGHSVQHMGAIKSWLFRVAYNEAMLIKRRVSIGRRHAEKIVWKKQLSSSPDKGTDPHVSQPMHHVIQQEDIEQVQEALKQLPDAQRVVVEKRIYEGLKFREIAEELDVPLGTVLARMQAALRKLKPLLKPKD